MKTRSWYEQGYAGAEREEAMREQSALPVRIWVRRSQTKEIVIVDDEAVCLYEHRTECDGRLLYFTCSGEPEAACCQLFGRERRYYSGFFTVVDVTPLSPAERQYEFSMKLLQARLSTLVRLKALRLEHGGLAGHRFRLHRSDDPQSPACGDRVEFVAKENMAELFGKAKYRTHQIRERFTEAATSKAIRAEVGRVFQLDDEGATTRLVPFNYEEILRPRSRKEIEDLLGTARRSPDQRRTGSRT